MSSEGNKKTNVENKEVTISTDQIGQVCRLPDGQLVLIVEAKDDLVAVRRLEGDQVNTIKVCRASELRPK
jgi:hypothetical protein